MGFRAMGPGRIGFQSQGSVKDLFTFHKSLHRGLSFPQSLPVKLIGSLPLIDKSGGRFPQFFFNFLALKTDEFNYKDRYFA